MKAILDADNIAFACAASAEDAIVEIAQARANEMVERILTATGAATYELWLSGPSNFRYGAYPEYKRNRKDTYRPKWEKQVRQFLVDVWEANTSNGCEADDMIGCGLFEDNNTIACHLDKDINMVPGWHYSWELVRLGKIVREAKKYYVTAEEGLRFFCYQMLVGDPTDNIKGLKGVGTKGAERFLLETPPEKWLQGIQEWYDNDEEFEMNAACLYIWRKKGDTWKSLLNDRVD